VIEKKEQVTIVLPHLPEKEASPNNSRGKNWPAIYKAQEIQHDEVILLVRNEGIPAEPWEKAHLHIMWKAADKRRRDGDNLIAAMKGHIDGLHYSGLIKDDSAQVLSISWEYEEAAENYETIMEITEVGNTTA